MNDSMQSSSMANYNSNFPRNNYGMNDQHGGMANNSSEYSPQNSQYNQYGQGNMPPGYSPGPRGAGMPTRPGMPSGNMNMMGQNYPPNQQRFPMSGPSIQQQGGPTPTLNQLLQNPNAAQRYQAGYGYPEGPQKGGGDMANQGYNPQGNWGNQQRPNMNPYQQGSVQGNQGYRPQNPMFGRPGMGGGYNGGQYPNNYPNGQRFPQPYNQMGLSSYTNHSNYTSSYTNSPPSTSPTIQQNSQPPSSQSSQPPTSTTPTSTSSKAENHQPGPSGDGGGGGDGPPGTPASTSGDNSNQGGEDKMSSEPPPQHNNINNSQDSNAGGGGSSQSGGDDSNSVSGENQPSHRPSPSPSAQSAGSRSNTPASVTGGGVASSVSASGSPMPPRPPSNSVDQSPQSQRIHSPMTTGYPQQSAHQQPGMMPPPGGAAPGSYPGPQKMQGNMMGGPQMPPYNSQYPNQPGYNRMGNQSMGGYPQQAGYGNQMYPGNNMGQGMAPRGPGMPNNYPNQYGQYNNYGNNMPPHSGGSGNMMNNNMGPMNSMGPGGPQGNMPVPSSTPSSSSQPGQSASPGMQSPGPKPPGGSSSAAQAAAHAAMAAAANQTKQGSPSSGQPTPPPQQTPPPAAAAGYNGPPGRGPPPPHMGGGAPRPPYPGSGQYPPQTGQTGGNTGTGAPPYGFHNQMQHQNSGSGGWTPPTSEMNGPVSNNSSESVSNNVAGMSGGHMVMNNQPPTSSSQIPGSLPPNAVAPTASSMSSIIKQESTDSNDGDQKPDVKPNLANSNSGDTGTSVTQSVTSPISQASTPGPEDQKPAGGFPGAGDAPVTRENGGLPPGADEENSNSRDSFKMRPDIKQEIKQESSSQHSDTPVAPSPSLSSIPEDEVSSPSWPGTPSQTVSAPAPPGAKFGNQEIYARLCDMGEEADRRAFLEKLFIYMEEKGTPITVVPSISKNSIDLYRLYVMTKERGGLLEVTKQKKWREIGAALNVGNSSSAGFTLKKNYCKYLFHYECRFDNNNIDPAPILAQIEAAQKKDSRKTGQSPAGGMMRGPGMGGDMMGQGPMMPPNVSMMPGAQQGMYGQQGDMGQGMMNHQQPGQQGNNPMMNMQDQYGDGMKPPGYGYNQGTPNGMGQNYPGGQYNRNMPGGQYPQQGGNFAGQQDGYNGGYNSGNQYPNRMPNQYGYDNRGYDQRAGMPPTSQNSQDGSANFPPGNRPFPNQMPQRPNTPDQYNQGGQYQGGYNQQQGYGGQGYPPKPGMYQPGTPQKPGFGPGYGNMPPSYGCHQDYYGSSYGSQMYFDKGMGDRNWQGMPPRFGPQTSVSGSGGYSGGGMGSMPSSSPSSQSSQYTQSPMYKQGSVGTPQHRLSPQRPDKPPGYYPSPQPPQKSMSQPKTGGAFTSKKDLHFPHDSVEATELRLAKRKRVNHRDLDKTEPWRLYMCLKSGLLTESTWALDTLNILLFDDHTVQYFGLSHMPGLVEVLVEHWRRCLINIFGEDFEDLEVGSSRKCEAQTTERERSLLALDEQPPCKRVKEDDSGRGSGSESESDSDDEESDDELFAKVPSLSRFNLPVAVPNRKDLCAKNNYTLRTRHGRKVRFEKCMDMHEVMFDDREWDKLDGVKSGIGDWELGRGDTTVHIITHMESGRTKEFARRRFNKHLPPKVPQPCGSTNKPPQSELDRFMREVSVASTSSSCSPMPTAASLIGEGEDNVKVKQEISSEAGESDSGVCVKTELDSPEDAVVKEEPMEEGGEQREVKKEDNLNDSSMDVKDLITSIECNEMDKKFLEKLKRKLENGSEETEAYQKDTPPLNLIEEGQDELGRRCICVSNIFRNLSFIPGNDKEMSKHPGLLALLGKVLLLHHWHAKRDKSRHKFDREPIATADDTDEVIEDGAAEWWWDTLDALRENALVILANIAGHLNLSVLSEEICMPVLNGLLHWAICPSACAVDPLPTMASSSVLSPQRLVLEALCKLCVTDTNVDLLLATPPFSRIVLLFVNLVRHLADRSDQVLREFAIVLLSSLVQGDSSAARAVALQQPSISLLIDFIESAEQSAHNIVNSHGDQGMRMLQENPEMMGTSLDMLRRAGTTLKHLAMVPENRSLFMPQQDRLLNLVMSRVLDPTVSSSLSHVLYSCSQEDQEVADAAAAAAESSSSSAEAGAAS